MSEKLFCRFQLPSGTTDPLPYGIRHEDIEPAEFHWREILNDWAENRILVFTEGKIKFRIYLEVSQIAGRDGWFWSVVGYGKGPGSPGKRTRRANVSICSGDANSKLEAVRDVEVAVQSIDLSKLEKRLIGRLR